MMVIQNRSPRPKWETATAQPTTKIHITLKINPVAPNLPGFIVLPKGKRDTQEIFKHWMPNGIPMIVTQINKPEKNQIRAGKNPPNTIQMILPINDIFIPLPKVYKISLKKTLTKLN